MGSVKPIKPRESDVRQWLKEAGEEKRRLLISPHAQQRMKERKIGRRQVLETLKRGTISEPLHKDVRGDWRCDVSWHYAGVRITVGAVLKLQETGEWVVVATVFEG
jgi:hypothetical protein